MRLFLVRHGRPLVDPDLPPASWDLDPTAYDDVWRLRESNRLPPRARWFCSPEPKAVTTASLLTDREVGQLDRRREHQRGDRAVAPLEPVGGRWQVVDEDAQR